MTDIAPGFDSVKERSLHISSALREIADLLGTPQANPITVDGHESIIPGLGSTLESDAQILRIRADHLDEGLFTILVLGRFKNGKSTLLNAMMGDKQLPVGGAPTTGVITMLVYGTDDRVEVYIYDHQEPRILTRDEFFEEYRLRSEDADELREFRFQNVRYAKMYTQHAICARGVRLVDSPGLGEHTSRSELTTNFLKESQAAIFVLNAIALLGNEEREFIAHELGQGRLDHVFFVINRVNQVDEEDIPDLQKLAHHILSSHFVDDEEHLDPKKYARRVFWVNAKGALLAREVLPPNLEKLRASGVKGFEDELEAFLTDDEMFQAQVGSSVQLLTNTIYKAYLFIESQNAALDQPIAKLKERRETVSKSLDDLETRVDVLEDTIIQSGEKVQIKLQLDLQQFIDQMEADWEQDEADMISQLDEIRFTDVAISGLNKARRNKIALIVKTTVENYLKTKFQAWSERATTLTEEEVEVLQAKVQKSVDQFNVRLNEARREFTGDTLSYTEAQRDVAINITTSIFAGGTGLGGILAGTLRRFFIVLLVLSLGTLTLFGWVLLVLMVFYELNLVQSREESFKRNILKQIIPKVYESLRKDLRSNDFTPSNLNNLPALMQTLRAADTPLSHYLWSQFSDLTRKEIGSTKINDNDPKSGKKAEELANLLIEDLNRIAQGNLLYSESRFEGILLSDETQRLLKSQPQGDMLYQLNRYLLVDAYPNGLVPKLNDLIARSVKAQFILVLDKTTKEMHEEIEALRQRMDQTIADLENEKFSADQEKARLDHIGELLLKLMNEIRTTAQHRPFKSFDDLAADVRPES